MAGVDFDSDALPVVPAFRQPWTAEVYGGVARMDAKPASLALGVLNVFRDSNEWHNKLDAVQPVEAELPDCVYDVAPASTGA